MSNQVDNIFITKWEAEVAHEYQQLESKLRQTVRNYTGVGKDFSFPRMEAVTATRNRNRHAPLVPVNVPSDRIAVDLVPIDASEMIDDIDALRTNTDLRKNYTEILTAAVNRELDQLIIEALDATTNTELSISNTLNATGMIEANTALTALDIPMEDRTALISVGGQKDILGDSKLVNRDYTTGELLSKGMVLNVNGFKVITHTGLPLGTGGAGSRRNFFYHRNSVGLAVAQDVKIAVSWESLYKMWLVNVSMMAGAKIIRPEGVQRASITD